MASVWNKIDSGLALIYANFLRVREYGAAIVPPHPVVAEGGKLHVSLHYAGDLGPVEDAGFATIRDDGRGRATGALRLEDLPAIAAREEVLSIHYGHEPQLHLDMSVPQIKADLVWTLGPAPGFVFGGNPGAGVIVGVVDTGVDIHHPFLWRETIPDRATRILRIWDLGLRKVGAETEPDVALLEGGAGGTYGVEYNEAQINDVIRGVVGAMPIRHKDCSGHGTHVASTAAGDGRFGFKKIGAAPRADLVIVKIFYLQNEPQVAGVTVGDDQRFKDAVTYIRNVAASFVPPRPFVINYSAGTDIGAHDGLDDIDDWISNEFRDAVSAGRIFVVSAGNAASHRQHATIDFTAAATIEIPFELFDDRVALTESDSCAPKDNTKPLFIDFFYPNGGPMLRADLKPQGEAAFTAGPALGGADVPGAFSGHVFTLINSEEPGHDGGVAIRRNQILVVIHAPTPPTKHLAGTYTVRLTAGGAMRVHAWCHQYRGKQRIELKAGPPIAGVTVEDRFLIGSTGCVANVISVAAYNSPRVGNLDVAAFSSRGPVARHGVGSPIPAKPDIGAPGVQIQAAKSADTMPAVPGQTRSMNGTSMAAPHVTGAVALLLQKNKTLTPSDVRTLLQTNALKVPAPVADEIGGGRLDAKKAFDSTP
jgi:subtilisin family serine protease